MVFRVVNLIRLNKMASFIFRGLFRKNKEKRDSFFDLIFIIKYPFFNSIFIAK